uniref:PNPLA domain-containing protein n=1 Tax=Gadus morhua TaxID=8049 RepID=A0A8C5FXQ3_GADMO
MVVCPHSVSFAGCGFLATYQLGVAQGLLTQAPWILHAAPRVLGASSGSLVAARCGVTFPAKMVEELLLFASRLNEIPLGPLNPSINMAKWLEYVLRKHLSNDSHRLANGRLGVAVTRLLSSKKIMVTDFHSKEELLQVCALLCSCFVPGYCGVVPPSFKGVHYVDGGFTSMLPQPDHSLRTLTVSAFSGEVDICPQNEPNTLDLVVSGTIMNLNQANSRRLVNALYPSDVEGLETAYHNGIKDAIHFLQSSGGSIILTMNTTY